MILPQRVLTLFASLSLAALWFPGAWIRQSFSYPWGRTWWLSDEAMISMSYGRNLSRGAGLTWDGVERVEGYSNFLWLLFMAGVHAVGLPDHKTSLAVILGAILCSALTVPVIVRLARLLGGTKTAAALAAAGFILDGNQAFLAGAGMENSLFTLSFLGGLFILLQALRRGFLSGGQALLLGMTAVVRVDGFVAVMILLVAFLAADFSDIKKQSLARGWPLIILPFAAYEIFRFFYFGELLGNTAHLKGSWWEGKALGGLLYVLGFCRDYPHLLALAVLKMGRGRGREDRMLALVLALTFSYTLVIGGDFMAAPRFLVHLVPLLWILAALALEDLSLGHGKEIATAILLLALSPALLFKNGFRRSPDDSERGNVEIGLLLRLNSGAESRIADFWAGNTLYFSARRGVDLLGKSDRRIARLRGLAYGVPGHNKFDYQYSLGLLRPEFVIAPWQEGFPPAKLLKAGARSPYIAAFYTNPIFLSDYRPWRVPLGTWRTIYTLRGSGEEGKRHSWKTLEADLVVDSLRRR